MVRRTSPPQGRRHQRALAGQSARNGFWKPLGPQRRNARGQFASGHHAPGTRQPTTAKAARKAATARRRAAAAIAPAARRTTPSRRAATRLHRAETRAAKRRIRASQRAAQRATDAAQKRRGRRIRKDNTARDRRYRQRRSEVRSIERFAKRMGRLGRRIARLHRGPLGRGTAAAWMWTATRVGNGVRSGSVVQALVAPFSDMFIRRPPAALPQPAPIPAAAIPIPPSPPADPLGMNLPPHPLKGTGRGRAPASHPVSPAPTPVFGPGSGYGLVRRDPTVTNQMDWSAVADQIRTWQPQTPEDTQAFLEGLPEGLSEVAAAFHAKGVEISETLPYAPIVADGLDALGNLMHAASSEADGQRGTFDATHATELEFRDKTETKPNAQHWTERA
ncbi:Hypothetical protein AJAP_42330 (plasmid) [Amycolatopsis japonica]|uniref:Uncharacterized protein n=1 Tax=Amycolatopsis japonica TaxID=208439 RepID=A0A075V725_9PSEU|nr:Hypothetical protein AJAP_42330 [Amycolatopsis japonica]